MTDTYCRPQRRPREELTVLTVEHVEVPVPVRPEHELPLLPLPLQVGEHRNLDGVVVVAVVGRELEVPDQLARGRVESDDGVGVEVVAEATPADSRPAAAGPRNPCLGGVVSPTIPDAQGSS
jgi:hypothetical protein